MSTVQIENVVEWKYLGDKQDYRIYRDGRVYSEKSKKFLTQGVDKKSGIGAKHSYFQIDGKERNFRIHNVVWETFNGKIKPGYVVKHYDGNQDNCHLNNLYLEDHNKNKVSVYDKEKWKVIPGFENYTASKEGEIYSLASGKILVQTENSYGYKKLNLYDEKGHSQCFSVHQLIYRTYKGDIPKGLQIDHIDRDKLNNHIDNLRAVSSSENNLNKTDVKQVQAKSHEYVLDETFICLENKYDNIDLSNFAINKFGQIKNLQTDKLLNFRIEKNGRHKVRFSFNKFAKELFVDRLVATIFVENLNNKKYVIHIDNDDKNDHCENLKWVSGRYKVPSVCKKIYMYTLEDKFVRSFDSGMEASEFLGLKTSDCITSACSGKQKTCRGYKLYWEPLKEDEDESKELDFGIENVDWKFYNDEKLYKILKIGKIYNTKRKIFICSYKNKDHLTCELEVEGKKCSKRIKNLVYDYFSDGKYKSNDGVINYIDGDSKNVSFDNLRLDVYKKNK